MATQTLLEPGRQIAIDYWRSTPHVWSTGYPEKDRCALCGEPDRLQHKTAVPEPAKPTVERVEDRSRDGYYQFVVYPSCGHGPTSMAVLPKQVPAVGSEYDCWTCHSAWLDANWPPLPQEIYERIDATVPHCPECGGALARIPFVQQSTHKFGYQTDGQTGATSASSEHHDTVDEEPAWLGLPTNLPVRPGYWRTGELEVSCENGHAWVTSRLAYMYEGGEHHWRILPEADL